MMDQGRHSLLGWKPDNTAVIAIFAFLIAIPAILRTALNFECSLCESL
ncbi:hypothetical protein EST38_g2626 [Candolleomyces aberdarensis]|uniref:Uncharacterized protein n=1 Tax=Candolleomyces aberdarensis TaxID=2316362 RepID=A0A4V1Q4T7_9AGAR|nr:hypothetical protein EST38_g2626 [Candolleomyces aberdarensis]